MGYSRESTDTESGLRICFSEKNPGIFRFVTLPLKIHKSKEAFISGNSAKFCDIPRKIQGQKPRIMEILLALF